MGKEPITYKAPLLFFPKEKIRALLSNLPPVNEIKDNYLKMHFEYDNKSYELIFYKLYYDNPEKKFWSPSYLSLLKSPASYISIRANISKNEISPC